MRGSFCDSGGGPTKRRTKLANNSHNHKESSVDHGYNQIGVLHWQPERDGRSRSLHSIRAKLTHVTSRSFFSEEQIDFLLFGVLVVVVKKYCKRALECIRRDACRGV
jgi:hypothetical protein